jgi:hypothetical protein
MRRKASEEEVERAASGASKVVGGAGRKANERGGRALEGVLQWAREDHRPERQRFALRQSRVDAACSSAPPEVLE